VHYSRGFCNMHWQRWRRHGDPTTVLPPNGGQRAGDPVERFWRKIDRRGPDECWLWTPPSRVRFRGLEYGNFYTPSGNVLAHRFAYELLVGPIPDDKEIDHLCRNTLCVNPAHLEPVPHRTNVLRGTALAALNAKKTHCVNGHPFDEANTYVTAAGHRRCRRCHAEHEARHRERKRQLQEVSA
jgi:hypothetical protein